MPSFTRSGRPSFELLLEPALGQDVDGVACERFEDGHCPRSYSAFTNALQRSSIRRAFQMPADTAHVSTNSPTIA